MLAFLLILAVSTAAARNEKIPGGEDTSIKEQPHFAQVLRADFGYLCSGSIISESYILTSANCFGPGFVRVGTDEQDFFKGKLYPIKKFIRHEEYDLMLIQVKTPFKFDDACQPIKLQENELSEDSVGWITGWGNGTKLHKTMVPIYDKELCKKVYEENWSKILKPSTVCGGFYGQGGINPCGGDLGGPLVVGGRLAGIISETTSCDEIYNLGLYIEVAKFHDWIQKHTSVKTENL